MGKRKAKRARGADAVIREALAARMAAGASLREIAEAAGYSDHSQLSRFARGERGLATGAKLDGLLRVLGLEIRAAENS
jgi:transcriptional regulator with XRE-family HTH domain